MVAEKSITLKCIPAPWITELIEFGILEQMLCTPVRGKNNDKHTNNEKPQNIIRGK
jgi:hypothetical protein